MSQPHLMPISHSPRYTLRSLSALTAMLFVLSALYVSLSAHADIAPLELSDPVGDSEGGDGDIADPLDEVQKLVDEGRKYFNKAKRIRRATRTRTSLYIKALKSLSPALLKLTDYISETEGLEMLQDHPLYQTITPMMDEALADKKVKQKLNKYHKDLLKALKAGKTREAFEFAQMITAINERDRHVKYLQGVLNRKLNAQAQ